MNDVNAFEVIGYLKYHGEGDAAELVGEYFERYGGDK